MYNHCTLLLILSNEAGEEEKVFHSLALDLNLQRIP